MTIASLDPIKSKIIVQPTIQPTIQPTTQPTIQPTIQPTTHPTQKQEIKSRSVPTSPVFEQISTTWSTLARSPDMTKSLQKISLADKQTNIPIKPSTPILKHIIP